MIKPETLAAAMKSGTIARKMAAACNLAGVEFCVDSNLRVAGVASGRQITVKRMSRKIDLAIGLHEILHCLEDHQGNTVQNECAADLFADAVMDLLYGDTWLFGRTLESNDVYSGRLDVDELKAFASRYDIGFDIDALIAEEIEMGMHPLLRAATGSVNESKEEERRAQMVAAIFPAIYAAYVKCGNSMDDADEARQVAEECIIYADAVIGAMHSSK
jgi:hypothetical protein